MKLVYCPACHDLFAIHVARRRYCRCRRSSGRYRPDGWHADVYGEGVMLGLSNAETWFIENGRDRPEPSHTPLDGQYPKGDYMHLDLFVQPPWHPQAHYHKDQS